MNAQRVALASAVVAFAAGTAGYFIAPSGGSRSSPTPTVTVTATTTETVRPRETNEGWDTFFGGRERAVVEDPIGGDLRRGVRCSHAPETEGEIGWELLPEDKVVRYTWLDSPNHPEERTIGVWLRYDDRRCLNGLPADLLTLLEGWIEQYRQDGTTAGDPGGGP